MPLSDLIIYKAIQGYIGFNNDIVLVIVNGNSHACSYLYISGKAGLFIEVHTPCQNMLGGNSDDLSRAQQYWHITSRCPVTPWN